MATHAPPTTTLLTKRGRSFSPDKGIRKRGKSYIIDISINGKRYTRTAATLKVARETRKSMMLNTQSSVNASVINRWTLQKAFEQTWELRWRDTRGNKTVSINAQALLRYFGANTPVENITSQRINEWVIELIRLGNAEGTINRKLAVLSRMLHEAKNNGALREMPVITRRREPHGNIRYLSLEEEKRVRAAFLAWQCSEMELLFTFLIDTGLRRGEALRLLWENVSLATKTIHVLTTKNDKPRNVPLTSRVCARLEAWAKQRGLKARDRVFTLTHHKIQYTWDKMRTQLQLKDDPQFTLHALRHTCASRLVQRGVGLAVVQAWLGHRNITMTLRYAHLAPSNLLEAVRVLEEWNVD
uniref:Site-specific recombinase XerD n=1 Tax=Candidatus Kentrum sp. TC TaxID=2126339 RepID=A0A450YY73_9GAMM|nr:MAG: Site-specific recombinase XerD [Candidatus Kentron sp. TC]